MKIHYENDTYVTPADKKMIRKAIEVNESNPGVYNLQELDSEELDEYYDDNEFANKWKNDADIYLVSHLVAGNWAQPITLIAVDY